MLKWGRSGEDRAGRWREMGGEWAENGGQGTGKGGIQGYTKKAASKRSGQTRKAGAPKERFAPVLKIVSGSEGFPTLQEMISEAGAST